MAESAARIVALKDRLKLILMERYIFADDGREGVEQVPCLLAIRRLGNGDSTM